MRITILKRVNIADFITYVRYAVSKFPSFLDEEKSLITKEIEEMEIHSSSSRRNSALNKMKDILIPRLWSIVKCLNGQLKLTTKEDKKAEALLTILKTEFKRRMPILDTIDSTQTACKCDTPDDNIAALLYGEMKRLYAEMEEIRKDNKTEITRIKSIMPTIKLRRRIIALLRQAYEVAKGLSHRTSTKDEAEAIIFILDNLEGDLKKHIGHRKRKGKTSQSKALCLPLPQKDREYDGGRREGETGLGGGRDGEGGIDSGGEAQDGGGTQRGNTF